jgi:transposase
MIESKGCELEYLPPYSPDVNPIEYSFCYRECRKNQHQTRGDETPVEFAQLILKAGVTVITHEIARNQFRHCMISVD